MLVNVVKCSKKIIYVYILKNGYVINDSNI